MTNKAELDLKDDKPKSMKTSDITLFILEKYPNSRDDDSLLSFLVYRYILREKKQSIDTIGVRQLMSLQSQGVLPKSYSIERSRRFIQSSNIDLRGKNYGHRLEKSYRAKVDISEITD